MTNQPGQGRKKTPTALVGIAGGKLRPLEPKPAPASVRMPRGMSARAQAQWRLLAPDLVAKGVLTSWDVDAFKIYCEQFHLYELAQAAVNEHGPTVRGRNGEPIRNPAFSVMRDCVELIRRIGSDFGLNPSARAGLIIQAPPNKRGLAEFL